MKPPNRFVLFLLFVCLLLHPINAPAFKIGTHVWIAQQVLNDVLPDGRVTIDGHEYVVDGDVLHALRRYQSEYRMGNIGPDGFPDLVVPQVTAHPGVKGGWQTDDWLRWMLTNVKSEDQRAFVLGYFGHVASDIFAHTYINNYTGDVFLLTDGEVDNEFRHFALETYIDDHLPSLMDHTGRMIADRASAVSQPSRFLADSLILTETVASEYLRPASKTATHLTAMLRVRSSLDSAIKLTELDPTGLATSTVRQRLVSWRADVDKSVVAYIDASANTAREFLKPHGDPLKPIIFWNECWSPVFLAVPRQVPQSICGPNAGGTNGIAAIDAEIEKLRAGLGPLTLIADPFIQIKNFVDTDLRRALTDASSAIAKNVGGDDVRTLIRLLNGDVSRAELNRVFSQDRSNKGLPVFEDVASRIDTDMLLTTHGRLDAERFQPVHDAIVLTKLTLLSPAQLNKLVRDSGVVGRTVYGVDLYSGNVLLDVVRSADGSYQWLGTAPAFKRRPGFVDASGPGQRQFGYEFRNDGRGFRLWWDPQAREKVFNKIFLINRSG
jgi:hypothetical protein